MSAYLSGVLHGLRKRGLGGSARVLAVLAFIALLVVITKPSPISVAVGAGFIALGETWRAWAAGHLLKSIELAVSGPYRYVQNPLYFGRLSIMTGIAVMGKLPITVGGLQMPLHLLILALVLIVFFYSYMPRKIRVEGERLARHHGASYTDWARAVPVVIPRLTPYGRNTQAWTSERFLANGEHRMVLFMIGIVLVFAWKAGLTGS